MDLLLPPSAAPPAPAPSPSTFPWVADDEPDAYEAQGLDEPLCELQIALPPAVKISLPAAEQFLLAMSGTAHPLGFEIIGQSDAITVQLSCRRRDASQVREQLAAYFPEAVVTEAEEYLAQAWYRNEENYTFVVDFGLAR